MAIENSERPPYVIFEMREIEDRAASIAAGHYVGRDVAYASITRPGSRDTLDKEALPWLKELGERSRNGNIPASWPAAFQTAYDMWVKGETGDVKGTPIKGWPLLGPAAQKTLISVGILSVEDLANIPDQELNSVGTGGVAYKLKAKNWLEQANGPGKQAEAMAALTVKVTELVELTRKQAEEITSLRAKLPQTKA